VTVIGVYSIRKGAVSKGRDQLSVGIRRPYLRVVGISVESEGPGRSSDAPVTPQEEVKFRSLAAQPDVYETIANSIAPSIYGSKGIVLDGCISQYIRQLCWRDAHLNTLDIVLEGCISQYIT
jgi:DNA replication licensing factor MCM5